MPLDSNPVAREVGCSAAMARSDPTRRDALRHLAGLSGLAAVLGKAMGCAQPGAPPGSTSGSGRTLRVGRSGDYATVALAARNARDGDIIEIEAGDYPGDVAVWTQRRVTIRSVGGMVRMVADGRHAEGKGIWVMRNGDFEVEGIEFVGARVPDRNGAGIRFEGGRLSIRRCRFVDNEMGILTGNDGVSGMLVEACDFAGQRGPIAAGNRHNLYVGGIGTLVVTSSYFHDGSKGHLLKTRARESYILYNRISDGGRASLELEFPNGGVAVVIGNLLVQESTTENAGIVSYGFEGLPWDRNEFVFVNNTVVNRRPIGVFVRLYGGKASTTVANNLFVGRGTFDGASASEAAGNFIVDAGEFVAASENDFRLRPDSKFRGRSIDAGEHRDRKLRPAQQYEHPLGSRPVTVGAAISPGAFQD